MLNKIILIGRMTKDPERAGRDPEKPIANIRIAVDRDYKRDGGPDADYFTCSAFGQQAKFILQYGRKGRLVSVVGSMQMREWEDQQTGEKRSAYDVVGIELKFLDKKPEDMQSGDAAQPVSTPTPAPAAGFAAPQGVPAPQGYPVQAMQTAAAPAPQAAPVMTAPTPATGYPQPVPGAAQQYSVPDFSGVPESYPWGPGGVPDPNPPF